MTEPGETNCFVYPASLSWLEKREDGRNWLKCLPDLLAQCRDRFQLQQVGDPFSSGNVSYVLPAKRHGADAVLKLQFPDRECRFEADALKHWDGQGAIRLLDHAPDLNAMLLERCRPGQFLADDPDVDPLAVLSGLLKNLLKPAGPPFTRLSEEAALWRNSLESDWEDAGRPCERRLVDAAMAAASDLPKDETDLVLLHQDLHGHNVLSSERSGWLAIDPKPLVGDPAFSLSPIVRSFEFGHSKNAALYRLDRLSEELGLDRERARHWTIAQTMAWAFSSDYSERHFETARWLLGAN
ncbi:aminoglycoside phosphotransferase family protein [Labrenzia sp. VG12]|uniref:aminoglycoside phosphotransferase family protein n=1 Tax=Labrenzia sp. VG12 TaxID=2021862 RepID=UPI000B8C5BF9|nr:aminoglycoside phosphotransferase family protein [Labrenzia sp. VG12]ASP35170.1 aminoglycoside phosphotransferase [Labrenzia sp. VG12]